VPLTVIDDPAVPSPGANVPPEIKVLPTVPMPPSVPPLTVKAALLRLPFTASAPPPTENAAMPALLPVSVQLPLPVFAPASNEESWATLKLPDPPPLRPSVSVPVPPSTLPLMTAPVTRSKRLAKALTWSNRMAPPAPPFTVPATVTVAGRPETWMPKPLPPLTVLVAATVMASAPVPWLNARMPVTLPLTVVPAAVVTVRLVPAPVLYAKMPNPLLPVTLPLAVMASAPVP
jgi:hypothetical protein